MRKKWTPQEDISDELLTFREKRKWQIALRRYVLEKKPSPYYAPYFALDINSFREWIELQFEDGIGWQDFSARWQLDHIIPITYFDFTSSDDLKLAWNFINIRVGYTNGENTSGSKVDVLAAKGYFKSLYSRTGYAVCADMVAKIELIEAQSVDTGKIEAFLLGNKEYLQSISAFNSYQFEQLNDGVTVQDIQAEAKLMGF